MHCIAAHSESLECKNCRPKPSVVDLKNISKLMAALDDSQDSMKAFDQAVDPAKGGGDKTDN